MRDWPMPRISWSSATESSSRMTSARIRRRVGSERIFRVSQEAFTAQPKVAFSRANATTEPFGPPRSGERADAHDRVALLGGARLHLDRVPRALPEVGRAERGLVGDDVPLRVAVPGTEDRVAGGGARGHADLDDAADAHLLLGGVLEVRYPRSVQVSLELALLRHEHLLVLLGHLVLGVLAQVPVLPRGRYGLRVLRDLLGDDG